MRGWTIPSIPAEEPCGCLLCGRRDSGGKDASQALDRGPAPVPGVDGCGRAFSGRDRLEASILGAASRALSMCGIGLLDVSLRRFDYSSGVRDQVYGRMIAERKAAAMRLLSEGEGQGSEISGRMEKELKEICQRP